MKVRVIKEMPFACFGDVITGGTNNTYTFRGVCEGITFQLDCVEGMIENGWLEEVKDESLEDKFMELGIPNFDEAAQIAKDHNLEVFNKYVESIQPEGKEITFIEVVRFRKALEDCRYKSKQLKENSKKEEKYENI